MTKVFFLQEFFLANFAFLKSIVQVMPYDVLNTRETIKYHCVL